LTASETGTGAGSSAAWLHGLPATTDSFLRIKRNAQLPAKATDAALIALSGDGVRSVSLDSAIRTMPEARP